MHGRIGVSSLLNHLYNYKYGDEYAVCISDPGRAQGSVRLLKDKTEIRR